MKSLLIVGAGQYGKVVKEIAEEIGYQKIDFLDDDSDISIGKVQDLEKYQNNYTNCICSIGNATIRKEILKKINNKVTLISDKAIVSKNAKIGECCVVEAGAIVNANAIIKDGCFICAGCVIDHNSIVDDYCQIDCNAVVKGKVPRETKVDCCSLWKG